MSLETEANYWNEEYKRCFGTLPNPPIVQGAEMRHVHAIYSAVMRHHVERLKEIIDEKETKR